MKVRVLMFGALGEAASKEDVFDVGEAVTASDVLVAVQQRYPHAASIVDRCAVAVDRELVDASFLIGPSAEVAVLPPMSGGAVDVRLTSQPSAGRALDAVSKTASGGTAVFVGTVRDVCELGPVERLEYSAYDQMASKVLLDIAQEAVEKWGVAGVAIEHGIGPRAVGETTFVVACAAAHRDEAFEACRYVVDEVKARAPIWKKEIGPWGRRWVGL